MDWAKRVDYPNGLGRLVKNIFTTPGGAPQLLALLHRDARKYAEQFGIRADDLYAFNFKLVVYHLDGFCHDMIFFTQIVRLDGELVQAMRGIGVRS